MSDRVNARLPKGPNAPAFSRHTPLGDAREVIVRCGKELGRHYGLPLSKRTIEVAGISYTLVRYLNLLSPPPLEPGMAPLSADAMNNYRPEYEVLYLPEHEVLFPRLPRGFTDDEVNTICAVLLDG